VYSLTGLNVTLAPSTYYYLVANYPDSPDNGNLLWSQGIVDSSNPAYSNHYSGSTDGTTWGFPQLNNQNPLKATINAVPEPSTFALIGDRGPRQPRRSPPPQAGLIRGRYRDFDSRGSGPLAPASPRSVF